MRNQLTGRPGRRRLGLGVAFSAAAAVLLTGCAAGQHAQTVGQVPAIDGVAADSGDLSIRNAAVLAPTGDSYAQGSDALLSMVLINNGNSADQLVSVSSTAATAAVISTAGLPESTPAATPSASPSAPAASQPIDLPPGASVQVGYSVIGANVELTGLTQQLFPSATVPVTFTFKSGATVNADLAVRISDGDTAGPTIGAATEASEPAS